MYRFKRRGKEEIMHLSGLSVFTVYTTYLSREDKPDITAAGQRDFTLYSQTIFRFQSEQTCLSLFKLLTKIRKPLRVSKITCADDGKSLYLSPLAEAHKLHLFTGRPRVWRVYMQISNKT